MKFFAESTPVMRMPYVHLGYLSASVTTPVGGGVLLASILAVAGGVMTMRVVREKTDWGTAPLMARFRRDKRGLLGWCMILAAVGVLVLAFKLGTTSFPHGAQATHTNLRDACFALEASLGRAPADPHSPWIVLPFPQTSGVYALSTILSRDPQTHISRSGTHDIWHQPIQLELLTPGTNPVYRLRSAGRDGAWGSPDDIVLSQEDLLDPARRAAER